MAMPTSRRRSVRLYIKHLSRDRICYSNARPYSERQIYSVGTQALQSVLCGQRIPNTWNLSTLSTRITQKGTDEFYETKEFGIHENRLQCQVHYCQKFFVRRYCYLLYEKCSLLICFYLSKQKNDSFNMKTHILEISQPILILLLLIL